MHTAYTDNCPPFLGDYDSLKDGGLSFEGGDMRKNNYEICKVCNKKININNIAVHLKTHNMTKLEYYDRYIRKKEDEGKCRVCGKPTNMRGLKYFRFCSSKKCVMTDVEVVSRRKNTIQSRYGVNDIAKIRNVQEKRRKFFIEKYNKSSFFETELFKNVAKQTCKSKYGNQYYCRTDSFKQQCKKTCLAKYGTDSFARTPEVIQKVKNTKYDRYGDANFNNRKKAKKTCLERYGVENPTQNGEIFDLIQTRSLRRKEYILPSGKIIPIQGYENMVLDELFTKGYDENDILTSTKEIHNMVGHIFYTDENNIKHKYYPDFYIISENKIIEVKSQYTYDVDLKKNMLKQKACLDKGLNFEFRILE